MIPQRILGRTGHPVSALGMGVSGPHAGAWTRAGHTQALIREAISLGVTLFDTAPFYGDGEAERRLGAALEGANRESLFIATKAGTKGPAGARAKDFSPDFIKRQLDDSLERLKLGYADALFLHGPAPDQLTDDLMSALADLKAKGRFRHLGMCGRGPEIDAALATGAFDLLMAPAHVRLTPPEVKRLAAARAANMGVLGIEVMNPALSGFRVPTRLSDLRRIAKSLRGGKRPRGIMTAEECMKYALSSGVSDCALFSTTRRAHLRANAALASSA